MWRAALVLCALALGALGDKELSLQTHTELANLAANPERTIEVQQ